MSLSNETERLLNDTRITTVCQRASRSLQAFLLRAIRTDIQ